MLRLAADTVTVTRANSDEMDASTWKSFSNNINTHNERSHGESNKIMAWLVNNACFRAHVLKPRPEISYILSRGSCSDPKQYQLFQMVAYDGAFLWRRGSMRGRGKYWHQVIRYT